MGGNEGTGDTPTVRKDGHLAVYVLWPLCGGLALAVVTALSVGGCTALGTGDWTTTGRTAGGWFFVTWPVSTIGIFLYAMWGWGGPMRLERARREVIEIDPGPDDRDEWEPPLILRPFGGRRRLPGALPALPAQVVDVERDAEQVAPRASREVEQLYRFVTMMWPLGDVTQAGCARAGYSRRWWDKYVGGSRSRKLIGTEQARGYLDRAGVVCKDSNKWVICADLAQALSINDELRAYAEAMSQVVRLDKSDETCQVTNG